ncbi:zinc-finger homeodomain protein 11-like [Papaver somniferum]|uniref:zinc-finger homeodomain protein 11-like n=1 Tax=Papaver somniferum TaxID=3469 RepID=UPI000E6FEA9E|nr:zinc-finger homeodomain protein 11-like [Papaver somniferum]
MADDTTPRGLYCDACGCHRNLHKKILALVDNVDGHELLEHEATASVGGVAYESHHQQQQEQQKQHAATLGGSTRKDEKRHSEQQETLATTNANNTGTRNKQGRGTAGSGYRRSRFSQTQKEKLVRLGFSIGWRMPTKSSAVEHEEEIRKLCNEFGITRFVFKTWMNNQKKYHVQSSATSTPIADPSLPPPGFS